MSRVREWAQLVQKAVAVAVLDKEPVVEQLLVALLARGHVLIEDLPGTGKTLLARALARSIGGDFKHVQCTPDLLPADVLGVSVFNQKTRDFEFKEGPIITNVLLVDEINRATPRTQSALLEAMAEGQVTVEGRSIALPDPFFLIATESPVESEGTFALPEVQKDRFFLTVGLGYPSADAELAVMQRHGTSASSISPVSTIADLLDAQREALTVEVSDDVQQFILNIIKRTRSDDRLLLPVSPRGSLALYKGAQALAAIRGRDFAIPEDVQDVAPAVLLKRMLLKNEHPSKGLTEEAAIRHILDSVDVPPLADAV
jgi:MoxR-like ATPase